MKLIQSLSLSILLFLGSSSLVGKEVYQYTPEIHGVLTQSGTPMNDQEVILRVGVRGDIQEFIARTDDQGRFSFQSVQETKPTSSSFLDQKYVLVFLKTYLKSGEEITIWESSIDGYEIDDFARKNMNNLNCEVTNELYYFAFSYSENGDDDTYVYSQCRLFGYVDSGIYEE